jgi:lipopolysaccharide/colanic/teichoic acid biosynthesis glycosyltransferase
VLLVDIAHAGIDTSLACASAIEALDAAKRGMDVLGWFERDAVLGLILPDLPDAEVPAKVELRVRRELAERVDREVAEALSVRLYAHATRSWDEHASFGAVDLLLEAFADGRGTRFRDGAKRAVDLAGSVAALVLLAPLVAVIAVLVKLDSPGPVHFRQMRIGRRGRPFTVLKFRTMHANVDHALHQQYVAWFIESSGKQPRSGDEVFKLTDDPRITRLGHVLRKTSLDELPQFWNVLFGEMSLVGPRPPLPFEVERYQPWHRRRVLDVKPGITGLWQVNGRSRTTFDEMVRLDLRYARTCSLWTDIRILAATPRAVISGKGAC